MIKAKFLTMSNNKHHPGLKMLETGLKKFHWTYEVIQAKYVAYGSKQIAFTDYIKKDRGYSHYFLCDAHDIIVLQYMDVIVNKLQNLYGKDAPVVLFNAEKGCWPYGDWANEYPYAEGPWKYLNGGAAFVEKHRYLKMMEDHPIQHTDNDQVNLARTFLDHRQQYGMVLDTQCSIFQSVAFEGEGDFWTGNGIVKNLIHQTLPGIIHGNGGTIMICSHLLH